MTTAAPNCYRCIHFFGPWKCMAYPDTIPGEIIDADVEHDTIRADQRGSYIFTPKPGSRKEID